MAVSKRLRYEVMRRDDHACRYCGAKAPDVKLTVDHVIPVALGGSDKPENLVTACADCNAGKSSSSPDAPIVANVSDDALRWAQAITLAAQAAAIRADDRQETIDGWSYVWQWPFENGSDPEASERADYHRDGNWRHSINRFLDAGLTIRELTAMADDTLHREKLSNERVWKYFCGMCWRAIEARQDEAHRLIETGVV